DFSGRCSEDPAKVRFTGMCRQTEKDLAFCQERRRRRFRDKRVSGARESQFSHTPIFIEQNRQARRWILLHVGQRPFCSREQFMTPAFRIAKSKRILPCIGSGNMDCRERYPPPACLRTSSKITRGDG